jgi:gas vesicle protein
MQYTLKNNTIKIDNGDQYYTGDVTPDMFPEEISENYEEIINQSFENYNDDKYNVTLTLNFDNSIQQIIINFQYKVKPFSFKRSIVIPIKYHLKDFKDYTNERIEKLENEIKDLREIISVLTEEKNTNNKIDDSENASDEEDDEDETEEDDEKEEIIQIPIRGGKKIPAVVQMKGGRQVVSKK